MNIDAEILAREARWLPHRLTDGGRGLRFIEADRTTHRSATFLDDTYLGDQCARADIPMAAVAAAAKGSAAPVHFIFHSAFARSTLLARALDIPGISMGLKEPMVLNDMVELDRQRHLSPDVLGLVLHLLGRPLTPGEAVVIKPSNVVNPLMMRLMQTCPSAKALLLYRDLPAYLRSVARKGMFGRIWARRLYQTIKDAQPIDVGFSQADIFEQTDLQVAAIGWLIQHAIFAALARAMPDRIRVLDADALVTARRAAFAAAIAWFDLRIDQDAIDEIIGGPAFSEDSKRIGERFDDNRQTDSPIDDGEIEMVSQWALAVAEHIGLHLDFGPRLPIDIKKGAAHRAAPQK